ncbi:MAG: flagellar basal-body rod protein FlgF [Candidatus Midichloriaceae bacterium]|jgi:flagellar basal-body rod protein FlgF
MDNSIYTTLSNQIALSDEIDIRANNMANISTDGFKKDMQVMSSYISKDKNSNLKMPDDISTVSDFTAGSLKQTTRPLDVAINGNGFFMIETPNGVRYSRSGNFLINNESSLIDMQGNFVLSQDGDQIQIPTSTQNLFINKTGKIFANNQEIGSLGVVDFENKKMLRKTGNGYFTSEIEAEEPLGNSQVLQGYLEESNTNSILETTKLIDVQKRSTMGYNLISDMYLMQRNSYKTISK